MAQGVPGRLRPRIFSTFGTTRVVGRQPYAPAALSEGTTEKKSQVTPPGIDPGTVRLVAQCLNHYATPGMNIYVLYHKGGKKLEQMCDNFTELAKLVCQITTHYKGL